MVIVILCFKRSGMFFSQRKFNQVFSTSRKRFSGRIYCQWIMIEGGKFLGQWCGEGGGNDGKEFKSGQLASFLTFPGLRERMEEGNKRKIKVEERIKTMEQNYDWTSEWRGRESQIFV